MRQDQEDAFRSKIDRVMHILAAALWGTLSIVFFSAVARIFDLAFALACVLVSPALLSSAFIRQPTRTPRATTAILIGMLGFCCMLVSRFALAFTFELSAFVLAWFGFTFLAISNLLLVGALGGALLARLRASA
jgi:Na+(H+)/acetate symporter ActP